MTDYTTVFVEGKVYWAKIVGPKALHDNYDRDGRQWAYELVPDNVDFLKEHRLLDRLKEANDPANPDKGEYLVLKKPEYNKDGEKNDPITIIDADQNEWDGKLLGNGTGVVAKLTIADFGKGKKKAIWTQAIMVTDLVPYEGGSGGGGSASDFSGYSGKAKGAGKGKAKPDSKGKAKELDDLEDDLPF